MEMGLRSCMCLLCLDQLCHGLGWCRVLCLMGAVSLCHSLSPYVIGTTNQPVKMTPNHGLHLSFRWDLCVPGDHPCGVAGVQAITPAPGQSWGHVLFLETLIRTELQVPQGMPQPWAHAVWGMLGGPLRVLGSRVACVETQP